MVTYRNKTYIPHSAHSLNNFPNSLHPQGYKDQQQVEQGFRFLKDPLFFAHAVFLKTERRIQTMLMIMGLALLVYPIAERKLREALKKMDETLMN